MNYIACELYPNKSFKNLVQRAFPLLRPVMHPFLHITFLPLQRNFGNVSFGPKTKEDYFKRELPQKI